MPLEIAPQRVPPVRALIPLNNRRGQKFADADIHRWMRLCRVLFKCQKIDLMTDDFSAFDSFPAFARELHLRVSIRTRCTSEPPNAEKMRAWNLLDVMLAPVPGFAPHEHAWLKRCAELGLPVRFQRLVAPLQDEESEIARLAGCGAVSVNFVDVTPIWKLKPEQTSRVIRYAEGLLERGIEVNLFGVPKIALSEALKPCAVSDERFFLDHQQYEFRSYNLAMRLEEMSPFRAGKIVQAMQLRYTAAPSPVDKYLLEWLFTKHRFIYFWTLFFRKLTRDRSDSKALPRPFREDKRANVAELDALDDPQIDLKKGSWTANDAWYRQHKYYDAIDRPRAFPSETQARLAAEARRVMANRPADEVVDTNEYGTEGVFHEPLSNAVRWLSISGAEKVSNVVRWIEGPFTAAVTFGGGRASYIGFRVGKFARILCPMEVVNHRLTLHVTEDGSYVLLRDGVPMQPIEFHARYYAPARLSFPVDLRLCLENIDDHVSTQAVEIWRGSELGLPPADRVQYSIIIFCTRFSRRLQAVLQAITHQRGIALDAIEVIIGYVPGVDTTDDVVDSIRVAHPNFRIVRLPFPDQYLMSKGFVINECARIARGEWIVLLDADIILPPDFFARLQSSVGSAVFLAPPSRRLLDRETTGRVLLGEIKPWDEWDSLLEQAATDRRGEAEGIPIGYCQIFRATCFEKVQYAEYEHFEGADGDFGLAMRREFGPELRLEGATVLHLDHGGSQWFGTYRHQ